MCLAAEILQTFQSQALQTEWEKVQTKILTNQQQRVEEDDVRKVRLEENLTKWRAQNEAVQKTLDDKIASCRQAFNDAQTAMQVDLTDMEGQMNKVPKFGGGDDACFEFRKSLTNCYKEASDGRKCDDLVNAMEMCVKKTVMSS